MGLSSSTLSLEGVAFSKLSKTHSIMFRFVALFALVAVAAAEPQWVHPYAVHNAAHLKTPSGDTVSVQAATIPYTHGVYSGHYIGKREAEADSQYYTHTYAGVHPYYNNVYNTGVYGAYTGLTGYTTPYMTYGYPHHLGKRDADSQVYPNAYTGYPYYNNVYNTAHVYGGYTGYPYTTYGNVWNRFLY